MTEFYLLAAVSLLILSGSNLQSNSVPAEESSELGAYKPPVKTLITESEEIQNQIYSSGNISYARKADITVSVDGRYKTLNYEEGDKVTSGAVVAQLSNVQVEIQLSRAIAAVSSARAELTLAQANYDEGRNQFEARFLGIEKTALEIKQKDRELQELHRTHEDQAALFEVGGITESALRSVKLAFQSAATELDLLKKDLEIRRIGLREQDVTIQGLTVPEDAEELKRVLTDINTRTLLAEKKVAEARLISAQKELESAQALVEELSLKSPITGVIGARGPEVGEKASPGDNVYTVFESRKLHVVFPIQEVDAIGISRGMEVEVEIDALPGKKFTAVTDRISPIVDPYSGNVTIRAVLEGRDLDLQPGMFARVTIKIGSPRSAILIPRSTLVSKRGESGSIYTVRNGRVYIKSLQLGQMFDGNIEVLENLTEGELIIDDPSPILREGEEVNPGH